MYVALLRFSANKPAAAEHMAGHQDWIRRGVEDGVFLLVGSIQPGQGGAVLATGTTLEDFQARVAEDPFVVHDVVTAEVIEIAPNLTDPRLAFLKD
ncbi:YciI family protein [Streptomyces sp. NPDC057877]|uniref:YciI family protein n=1 Tax=Streptomyces sp. NPDC057877 TaxID=3346269 RepID=UPI0036B41B2C